METGEPEDTRRHYVMVILSVAKDLAGFFAALRMKRYLDE